MVLLNAAPAPAALPLLTSQVKTPTANAEQSLAPHFNIGGTISRQTGTGGGIG